MEEITLDPEWKLPNRKEEIAHHYHLKKIQELHGMIDRSKLRGKRKVTRFFVDNEYVENGYEAKLPKLCTLVYQGLLFHGNTETQTAWPSFKKLIAHSGEKNRNYISNALRLLKECGIIGVVQCKKGFKTLNLYSFQATDYWLSLDHVTKRLKLTDSLAQYPNVTLRSIKRRGVRRKNVDTLTNQINNIPNSLTSIGDVLKTRMQKWQMPLSVAIQEPSGHSVVRTAYEGDIPSKEIHRGYEDLHDSPDNTANLQGNRSIAGDTTDIPVNTAKLREPDSVDNATAEQRMRSIQSDTTESPLKNGGKMGESFEQTHNELSLEDIRNDDLGPGTAE